MPENSPVVAVVGAGGFLGSRIVRSLAGAGCDVRRLGRLRPPVVDGCLAPEVAIAGFVIWTASAVNPMLAASSPHLVAEDHARFSEFLDLLAKAGSLPTVFLLSSGGAVYGGSTLPPYSESSPLTPENSYGNAKVALERRLGEYPGKGIVLRVSNAYGPGQPAISGQGVVAHWFRAVAAGEDLVVFGDNFVARDYIFVDDVAEAVHLLIRRTHELPAVLNIGSGIPISLAVLIDGIRDIVGFQRIRVRYAEARAFDASANWLDCSLAELTLDWRARTSLHAGLAATWAWLTARAVGDIPDRRILVLPDGTTEPNSPSMWLKDGEQFTEASI